LTFTPVAVLASETWWAQARCVWRAASMRARTYNYYWPAYT